MKTFNSLPDPYRRLLSKLLKVQGDTPYAIECRKIKSVDSFLLIVQHFREQNKVAPDSLKKILGEGAYDALLSLEEAMPMDGKAQLVYK